jgi:hypothetical protein
MLGWIEFISRRRKSRRKNEYEGTSRELLDIDIMDMGMDMDIPTVTEVSGSKGGYELVGIEVFKPISGLKEMK